MKDNDTPRADADLLFQAQRYLTRGANGAPAALDLEAAWTAFYDHYSPKIRKFAFACGATEEDVADCTQDVWTELLVRLPTFQLDPQRGQFDTWLYRIVRGKAINLRRARGRRFLQSNSETLETAIDSHPSPARALEDRELCARAWDHLKKRLSDCNLQILQMRLLEKRPVAEVAEKLGLSQKQVWYRYHRARREVDQVSRLLTHGPPTPHSRRHPPREESENKQKPAQEKTPTCVSRSVRPSSLACLGGTCVDYVFQRLELGRRELAPEWKIEWNCGDVPRPVLSIRKLAMVAYAEICGPSEFINANWPRIVNAAISAGVAAGIATIIATPTAALPVFRTEFYRLLQAYGAGAVDEKIQVALSAKQEANGPWCVCKD